MCKGQVSYVGICSKQQCAWIGMNASSLSKIDVLSAVKYKSKYYDVIMLLFSHETGPNITRMPEVTYRPQVCKKTVKRAVCEFWRYYGITYLLFLMKWHHQNVKRYFCYVIIAWNSSWLSEISTGWRIRTWRFSAKIYLWRTYLYMRVKRIWFPKKTFPDTFLAAYFHYGAHLICLTLSGQEAYQNIKFTRKICIFVEPEN